MNDSTTLFLMLLGTALVVSAVGFRRLVWFISVGYGYAIAAMALVLAWLAGSGMPWLLAAQLALLLIYGLRLGTHVLVRDYQAAYRRVVQATYGEVTGGFGKKFAIWVAVSLLYVMMFFPAAFHALRPGALPLLALAGLILMASGLLLEGVADWQKSAGKKIAPERFCDHGLFAWVRCPAYLGEIIFWIGNWITGAPSCVAWWHWTASLAGLVCILLIMLGSTKRLEASQQKRYGQMPEFQRYTQSVPILIPWVPIYSVQGLRWTLG